MPVPGCRTTEEVSCKTHKCMYVIFCLSCFQDKLVPLMEWLDRTEKQVKDMELVPTDEEKIQQRIKEHNVNNTHFSLELNMHCLLGTILFTE